MDAGPLDVLEQAGDQDVASVGDGVDVDLDALEVAVDPDRPIGVDDGRHRQLADEVRRSNRRSRSPGPPMTNDGRTMTG